MGRRRRRLAETVGRHLCPQQYKAVRNAFEVKFLGRVCDAGIALCHRGFDFVCRFRLRCSSVDSKLLLRSDNAFISAVQKDGYYCFLVPLTLPILVVAVYFHWLNVKLFEHA